MSNKTNTGFKIITINRKASFNYFFKEMPASKISKKK